MDPVLPHLRIVGVALSYLLTCFDVPRGNAPQFPVVLVFIVDNFAVEIIGMVENPTPVTTINHLVTILVVHGISQYFNHLFVAAVFGEGLEVLLVEDDVLSHFPVLDGNSGYRFVANPPGCSFGYVFKGNDAPAMEGAVCYSSLEKDGHIGF